MSSLTNTQLVRVWSRFTVNVQCKNYNNSVGLVV